MKSPEETGHYECPKCGNRERFTGIDANGYGGPDSCEGTDQCGKTAGCVCVTELTQDFDVIHGATSDGFDGEIRYHEFTGGEHDSEIGSYTRIVCRDCNNTIWVETPGADFIEAVIESATETAQAFDDNTLVIFIEGGVVQNVVHRLDSGVRVVIIDFDGKEEADAEDAKLYLDEDGRRHRVYAFEPYVEAATADVIARAIAAVEMPFDEYNGDELGTPGGQSGEDTLAHIQQQAQAVK